MPCTGHAHTSPHPSSSVWISRRPGPHRLGVPAHRAAKAPLWPAMVLFIHCPLHQPHDQPLYQQPPLQNVPHPSGAGVVAGRSSRPVHLQTACYPSLLYDQPPPALPQHYTHTRPDGTRRYILRRRFLAPCTFTTPRHRPLPHRQHFLRWVGHTATSQKCVVVSATPSDTPLPIGIPVLSPHQTATLLGLPIGTMVTRGRQAHQILTKHIQQCTTWAHVGRTLQGRAVI